MPALPVITDVIRTTVHREDGQGRSANNVMHFLSPGYDVNALDLNFQTANVRAMWDPIWDGYGFITLNYLPLDGTSATTTIIPGVPADFTGEGTGELIPAESALIKLRTGLRGRSHRGRIYLGGIGEDRNQDGANTSATVSELQDVWSTFVSDMDTAGTPLHVASYTLATSSPVVSVLAETIAGTQRRRQSQLR